MNKFGIFLLICILLTSCYKRTKRDNGISSITAVRIGSIESNNIDFEDIFKKISPEELTDNVFKLIGKDFTVITAGKADLYNSMIASFGGWGILFGEPTTWCFLRANRYTLEIIAKEKSYTMSYFADEYKDQILFLGSKSGRNSEKMRENTLTMIQTPSENISYEEARLIIECTLTEVTTVNPEDFYIEKDRKFITDA